MEMILKSRRVRFTFLLLALLVLLASVPASILRVHADDGAAIALDFSATNVTPRDVEDTTQKAIQREYAAAWKNMEDALAQNRLDLIDQSFVGTAHNELVKRIEQQEKNGLSTKFVDKGHKAEVVFYSPEGTALQLRDTAEFEQQTMDGGKTVHTETLRQQYTVIFTLVEDRWKVRILQALPAA